MDKNYIPPIDEQLFAEMKGKYVSETERLFFEKMQEKEEQETTLSNDVILSEYENEDELYIVREISYKYILGKGKPENRKSEYHVNSLYDALHTNLKDICLIEENLTLIDWLRKRNYEGIQYDGNNDFR